MVETVQAQETKCTRQVAEALSVSFVADDHVSIQLRTLSPGALLILSAALKTLDPRVKLTLDLYKATQLCEDLVGFLVATQGRGRTVHVSNEMYAKLQSQRYLDACGKSCERAGFHWQVLCTAPGALPDNHQHLSSKFMQDVAAELKTRMTYGDACKAHNSIVQKARNVVGQYFSIKQDGAVYEAILHSAPPCSAVREAFVQALKEQLPADAACRIDLRVLGAANIQECTAILVLCKSRQALGALPLELVVSPEIQRRFPAKHGPSVGYVVTDKAAQLG